jgi:hypothetical protein
MRRCMVPVLVVLATSALHAQVADTAAFPPVPSTVPFLRTPIDPADAGFGQWRRVPIPRHDKTPAAWTLRAGDWDFLMGTPRAMDAMDSSRIIDTTLANCRRTLNISSADSLNFANARPWAPFDSMADGRPVLVISIMPVLRNFTECGFKNLGRPAMIRRGMRFVTYFAYDASRDPVSAVLISQSRIVNPTMLAIAPVMVMSAGGIPRQSTSQLRLYIPYDAIAPRVTGDMPHVELRIWTKAGGEPDIIPLPSDILHTVWWEYLRWRSERMVERQKSIVATPPAQRRVIVKVPTPTDTALKTAMRRLNEGRDVDAMNIMLERLTDDKISINDRRIDLMTLASTFQADDDIPSAALVANDLTSLDPCAMSGTELTGGVAVGNQAYTGMRAAGALLDHTRIGARCFSYKPGATFLRGLIPGYGQYKTWSHIIGLSTGVLTVTMVYTSYAFSQSANDWYARYQAERDGYAARKFTQATMQRQNAQLVGIAAGVVWIGSAIEAEWQERVHAARLNAVHDFWFKPLLSVVPGSGVVAPSLVGGLKFEFR